MASDHTNHTQPKGLWMVQDTWRASPHLAHNIPRLAENAKLSIALKALMPDTMKTGWSAFLSEQTLTLKVQHNAIATRIKQIAPLLIDGLAMTGWAVNKMEVKVSRFNQPVWLNVQKDPKADFTPRILSSGSAQHITSSMTHLPEDSPLYEALARILATHKKS